jgi:ferredoxin--NADP+ reductase
MLEDVGKGFHLAPEAPSASAAEAMVRSLKPSFVSYEDWKKLDALEVERAQGTERPRVKFTSVEEMLSALRKGS